MEPIQHPLTDETFSLKPILKQCPFCSGQAKVTTTLKPLRYGVDCSDCPAEIPALLLTQGVAIRLWNRRSGMASAFGGRATKGKSSWRKRRACRRNLRIARRKKKLKQIRTHVDVVVSWLKEFRAGELAEMQAAVAQGWEELKVLEPVIMAD